MTFFVCNPWAFVVESMIALGERERRERELELDLERELELANELPEEIEVEFVPIEVVLDFDVYEERCRTYF